MKTTFKMTAKIFIILFSLGMLFHLNTFANGNDNVKGDSSIEAIRFENDIVLEDWMIDLSSWNESGKVLSNEEELVVEDWMVDAGIQFWNTSLTNKIEENDIKIEDWMTDLSQW